MAQWVALLFGVLTLGFGWHAGRRAVAAVRARRYGTRETAVVTGTRRTAVRVNNRPRYRLTWREVGGREGQSLMHSRRALESYPEGSEITVFQGINRAWWTGDVGGRPAD